MCCNQCYVLFQGVGFGGIWLSVIQLALNVL